MLGPLHRGVLPGFVPAGPQATAAATVNHDHWASCRAVRRVRKLAWSLDLSATEIALRESVAPMLGNSSGCRNEGLFFPQLQSQQHLFQYFFEVIGFKVSLSQFEDKKDNSSDK